MSRAEYLNRLSDVETLIADAKQLIEDENTEFQDIFEIVQDAQDKLMQALHTAMKTTIARNKV